MLGCLAQIPAATPIRIAAASSAPPERGAREDRRFMASPWQNGLMVVEPLRMNGGRFCNPSSAIRAVRSGAEPRPQRQAGGIVFEFHVHLPDPSAVDEANELISRLGVHAASEAAARAERSRELGNVLHFCRWRQIQRFIALLQVNTDGHTIH